MSAADFLDTNILLYAYDAQDTAKQSTARQIVLRALDGEFLTSSQVLGEFTATMLHKWSPRVPATTVTALLDILAPIRLVAIDAGIVRRAAEAHSRYGLHFYDGMIVAAAERGGCKRILSEDMNAGQKYFDIVVENPFV